jgi:NRPS condensation-like uncharacterized protein
MKKEPDKLITMDLNSSHFTQKIEYARMSLWAPFYAVGMVARIQGDVPPGLLKVALRKLSILYPPLASRVLMQSNGDAYLTTEGVGDFTLEVRSKKSDCDWEKVVLEQEQVPFSIERGPLTRFFLLRNSHSSDLIVIAPHVICDGYSMTHVMYDLVSLLNDPDKIVTQPDQHLAVTWKTVQHSFLSNLLLRGFVRFYNQMYTKQTPVMNQERYEELYSNFWARHHNNFFSLSLSPSETNALLSRCKQHQLAVTGALFAANFLTQTDLNLVPAGPDYSISIPVNIRKWMHQQPEKVIGVFASSVEIKLPIKSKSSFWELARLAHTKIHKVIKNRSRILRVLVLDDLNPLIADNIIAALSTEKFSDLPKLLTHYVKLDPKTRYITISNIGRIHLPSAGRTYPLETLLPLMPTGPGYKHSICALTVNDQMHLALRFHQLHLDEATLAQIKERMMYYLLCE